MKKVLVILAAGSIALTSCVSKKKFTDLQNQEKTLKKRLALANSELSASKKNLDREKERVADLKENVKFLKEGQAECYENIGGLVTLSQDASKNMDKTLKQLATKDKYIAKLREANNKKDSLNLAVAFNLKRILPQGLNDDDISVNIEGTKVFISISNKILFGFGKYDISKSAEGILGKVAKVIGQYPNMDVIVEGHTDNKAILNKNKFVDNWDLSVKRSAAVVRELVDKYEIAPSRLVAAGRSQYQPVVDNDTDANRAKNRRTKIIIMPKLDEFFDILDSNK